MCAPPGCILQPPEPESEVNTICEKIDVPLDEGEGISRVLSRPEFHGRSLIERAALSMTPATASGCEM
jgi:hypothetical protein